VTNSKLEKQKETQRVMGSKDSSTVILKNRKRLEAYITLVGDVAVGKTSIVRTYIEGKSSLNHAPGGKTIEN
jgi:GTPase SAR1 family protein